MECSCGASTRDARAERSKAGIVLEYRVCSACGRNEYGALLVRGKAIARGLEAQRRFAALEAGTAVEQPPAPAPAPSEPVAWYPTSNRPTGNGLIRVRFTTGGYYIERPSFFDERWDLIEAWQPYDNGPALAAASSLPPIPPELRVGAIKSEPIRVRTPRPLPPMPPPQLESVPLGTTLSLF